MPSTGTPSSKTTVGTAGGSAPIAEAGPPERITPQGAKSIILSAATHGDQISAYTPASRTRLAMSRVYCEPKSRMRIFSAPGSETVIGGLLGDRPDRKSVV